MESIHFRAGKLEERECRGLKPFAGARGVLASPPFLAAVGGKSEYIAAMTVTVGSIAE